MLLFSLQEFNVRLEKIGKKTRFTLFIITRIKIIITTTTIIYTLPSFPPKRAVDPTLTIPTLLPTAQ